MPRRLKLILCSLGENFLMIALTDLSDLDDFFRFDVGLFRHFYCGKQGIYARINLNEGAEALNLAHCAGDNLSILEFVFDFLPGIGLHLLQAQADVTFVAIDFEHFGGDHLTDLKHI